MRDRVSGEQYAQVDNQNPFAPAVWRSPVHRTPDWVIWLVQLVRLLVRVVWFIICHPLLDAAAGLLILTWVQARWPGVIVLVTGAAGGLAVLRIMWPHWFTRFVTVPVRCRWRWWVYRRRWRAVMTIGGLAPMYRGRVVLPVLGTVEAGKNADRVAVRLVSGQSPKLFADRAEALAHGFGVRSCRVRTGAPGMVCSARIGLSSSRPSTRPSAASMSTMTPTRTRPEDHGASEDPRGSGPRGSLMCGPGGESVTLSPVLTLLTVGPTLGPPGNRPAKQAADLR